MVKETSADSFAITEEAEDLECSYSVEELIVQQGIQWNLKSMLTHSNWFFITENDENDTEEAPAEEEKQSLFGKEIKVAEIIQVPENVEAWDASEESLYANYGKDNKSKNFKVNDYKIKFIFQLQSLLIYQLWTSLTPQATLKLMKWLHLHQILVVCR